MSEQPWTFAEAKAAVAKVTQAQHAAEEFVREQYADKARKEEAYRLALAKKIVEVHDRDGVAWSVASDVARGDSEVARLRRERDIAEGMCEAASQLAWRRTADRKDAHLLMTWSMRRELAEFHGRDPEGDLR